MIQKQKVWKLNISQMTANDTLWLQKLQVDVKCEALNRQVYSSGKLVSKYTTGYTIGVTTSCSKQETMLKLKFADKLFLISEENT